MTPEQANSTKSIEQLERESIARLTLELAACAVERLNGNPTYTQAWRLAARAIRSMKKD